MFPVKCQAISQAQMMYVEELLHRHRRSVVAVRAHPNHLFAFMPTPVAQEINADLQRMIRQAHLLERSFAAPAAPRG